jgi:four helix bundle protein
VAIKDYRDLLVWQKSMSLAKEIYLFTESFPQHEIYGITNQMRRSAVSVPSNIAEGHGREAPKEFARFLRIARGSLSELQTQLYLSTDLNYGDNTQFNNLMAASEEIGRMLRGLQNTLDSQLSALD